MYGWGNVLSDFHLRCCLSVVAGQGDRKSSVVSSRKTQSGTEVKRICMIFGRCFSSVCFLSLGSQVMQIDYWVQRPPTRFGCEAPRRALRWVKPPDQLPDPWSRERSGPCSSTETSRGSLRCCGSNGSTRHVFLGVQPRALCQPCKAIEISNSLSALNRGISIFYTVPWQRRWQFTVCNICTI